MTSNRDLTPAELDAVRALIFTNGGSNKDVAARIGCSLTTARNHLRNAMPKLNTQTRTGLALAAVRAGLVDIDGGA